MTSHRRCAILAALLLTTGGLHFVSPGTFDRMIPAWVPGDPRHWTVASGLAELLSGALLLGRRSAHAGALAAATTFVVVFPANVQMALDASPGTPAQALLWARLPLQVPLVAWAIRCRPA